MTPKLSVITACYQHGHFLRESAASVLAQTERDIELIIVDDCSTDDTRDVMRALFDEDERVRVRFNGVNRGLAYSQNLGIAQAQAPWVLKVDADDAIGTTYVAEILAAAAADPRRNIIFSPCFDGSLERVYRYPPFVAAEMIDRFMIPGPAAFKRELWDAVGGYDETMRSAEDWDFYIRAHLAVGLVPHQLKEPRWFYRRHSGPRASAEGIAKLPELQRYWRGHTADSLGLRSWAQWCAARQAVPA